MIVAISEAKCLRTKPLLGVLVDEYEERAIVLSFVVGMNVRVGLITHIFTIITNMLIFVNTPRSE